MGLSYRSNNTLSYVLGIHWRQISFKEWRVHQRYKYMFMLVYKCILASSFAGWRKYVGNFMGVFGAFRQAGLLANGSSAHRGYPPKSVSTCKKPTSSAFRISKIWLLLSKIHRILTKQRILLAKRPTDES
jgi:hypothetical protein